ncbi:MAG: hypothetical protein MAG471_00844 [Acidimicrobiaceae bacterium]|nr:hypothetical protein [Acidimicrobiaceae bacterium]
MYGHNGGRQLVVLRYPGGDREEVKLVSNNQHLAIDSGAPAEGFFRQGLNASVEYLRSNHAAWDSSWILHVPWVSMRAGVAG